MQIQAADYPLQVEPAQVLGFDCGLGAGLRICIFFGNKTHKKGHDVSRVLFCGLRGPKARSALRDFNAQGGRAAPAPRFCLGQNARTAHPRRRPEGRLGGSSATVPSIQNIHFNRPFHKKGICFADAFFVGYAAHLRAESRR